MWLTFILATHTLLVFAEDAPRDLKHFKGINNSMDLKKNRCMKKVGFNFYISLSTLFYKIKKLRMIRFKLQTMCNCSGTWSGLSLI